jgi:hypothetical protein
MVKIKALYMVVILFLVVCAVYSNENTQDSAQIVQENVETKEKTYFTRTHYFSVGLRVSQGGAASIFDIGLGRIGEENFFTGVDFGGFGNSQGGSWGGALSLGRRWQIGDYFQIIGGGILGAHFAAGEKYGRYKYWNSYWDSGTKYGENEYYMAGTGPFVKFLVGKNRHWFEFSHRLFVGFDWLHFDTRALQQFKFTYTLLRILKR